MVQKVIAQTRPEKSPVAFWKVKFTKKPRCYSWDGEASPQMLPHFPTEKRKYIFFFKSNPLFQNLIKDFHSKYYTIFANGHCLGLDLKG